MIAAVAFNMWKAEADRAAPNVGKHRTPQGFAEASDQDRTRWLMLADAAIAALNTGKEVMPSDPAGRPAEGPRNTAPAGLSAGGGAEPTAVQPVTVRLVFSNADATPKTTVLDVSAEAVPDIMAWYGAYCAGDRYTVTVDGRNVPMDQNGEPAHVNETPKREHDTANMLTPATKGGA